MSYVSFSPDGKEVATDGPGADGHPHGLSIWRFADGTFVRSIDASYNGLSANWRYAIRKRDVIDLQTGSAIYSASGDARFVFSADSRYVVLSPEHSGAGNAIRVISLPDGHPVAAFGSHPTSALAISPDDRTMASGHWGMVMLRDLRSERQQRVLRGFDRYVSTIAFSPNGRWLVAVTDVGALQIWDLRTLRRSHVIQLEGDEPSTPIFSPDGRRVAVGMYGAGTAFVVDVKTGRLIARAKPSDLGCGSVAFSPDGRYLITPSTGGLITWPYDDGGGAVHVYRLR